MAGMYLWFWLAQLKRYGSERGREQSQKDRKGITDGARPVIRIEQRVMV